MAPAVGRLWITANGAAVDGMAELLAAVPNATVTDAAMGEGWAQAVRADSASAHRGSASDRGACVTPRGTLGPLGATPLG